MAGLLWRPAITCTHVHRSRRQLHLHLGLSCWPDNVMLWRAPGQDAALGMFIQAARESWLPRDCYFKQGEKWALYSKGPCPQVVCQLWREPPNPELLFCSLERHKSHVLGLCRSGYGPAEPGWEQENSWVLLLDQKHLTNPDQVLMGRLGGGESSLLEFPWWCWIMLHSLFSSTLFLLLLGRSYYKEEMDADKHWY